MSDILWPAGLPQEPQTDFSVKAQPNILRTQMDGGNIRQRLRFTQENSNISLTWEMTDTQFMFFASWHRHVLNYGMNWFILSLPISGGGYADTRVRFPAGEYNQQYVHVGRWKISASLETEARPVLSEGALELISEYGNDPEALQQFELDVANFRQALFADWHQAYDERTFAAHVQGSRAVGVWSCIYKRIIGYTGPLMRVVAIRTGNPELDIYALPDGSLDIATLLAFAQNDTCRVKLVYDQSGLNRDLEQLTTASQPMIADAGSLMLNNLGLPAMTGGSLTVTFATTGIPYTVYANASAIVDSNYRTLWRFEGTTDSFGKTPDAVYYVHGGPTSTIEATGDNQLCFYRLGASPLPNLLMVDGVAGGSGSLAEPTATGFSVMTGGTWGGSFTELLLFSGAHETDSALAMSEKLTLQ
jgi:hypothetical protein